MKISTVICAATGNLDRSKCFYDRLKFDVLSNENPFIVSDGKAIIEINPERTTRNGFKIYQANIDEMRNSLVGISTIYDTEDGFLAADPNGIRVHFTDKSLDLDFQQKDPSSGLTGNFSGMAIEAHETMPTVKFWEAIGYKKTQGDPEKGWAVYSNGSTIDISIMRPLMAPHLFFNPGLTYFNSGANLAVIEKLRDAEIKFTEEITIFNEKGLADNVIINDPGGLGFFIFND